MNKYIDVRGPNPVYVNGMFSVTLPVGTPRGITVEEAEALLRAKGVLDDNNRER